MFASSLERKDALISPAQHTIWTRFKSGEYCSLKKGANTQLFLSHILDLTFKIGLVLWGEFIWASLTMQLIKEEIQSLCHKRNHLELMEKCCISGPWQELQEIPYTVVQCSALTDVSNEYFITLRHCFLSK